MATFRYEFEWDPIKAAANFDKHGLDFERATAVFQDPLAITIPDDEHTDDEARWITMEKDAKDRYVLVVHTFVATDDQSCRVPARAPTKREIRDYEETQ